MRHRVKNIKFHDGVDSDRMIMRKLVVNFLEHGHVLTTLARAKAMKQRLDRVISRMKKRSEQNTIYLKRYFPDRKTIDMFYDQVGKAIATIDGGYVRIERMNQRPRDGAMMVRVEWAHAIVIDWDGKKDVEKAITEKSL